MNKKFLLFCLFVNVNIKAKDTIHDYIHFIKIPKSFFTFNGINVATIFNLIDYKNTKHKLKNRMIFDIIYNLLGFSYYNTSIKIKILIIMNIKLMENIILK